MKVYSIEGNIGSGKSTLLELLKIHYQSKTDIKVVFIDEPLDVWLNIKDESGKNMLEKYYQDQDKYAFSFQMMAYISKLEKLINSIKTNTTNTDSEDTIFISERSLYTDSLVFAKMLYESGKIEDVNYQIYKKWFDFFIQESNIPEHCFIYVNTLPEKCQQRIMKRQREGEEGIPLEYLENCHRFHLDMMTVKKNKNQDIPNILTIDGNIDITDGNLATEITNNWIKEIDTFIQLHTKK